ncbi:MAG: conjugal transfer protein TraH [Pseudomonadales bacterium]|nr:conjugal transfer protein TraH [Pseudomonadales bacterium]
MKKQLLIKAVTLILAFGFPLMAGAGTSDKVSSWFDNMNYSNVTGGGVYEGQGARYATLGGVSARAPITQPFNFVSVQTPKFSAGCGGIDFYSGGFSAIDADQFVENLRAIGQNAQSLAYMLAIQIVSPQLSGVMERIQTWADKYLNLNMDSCEAARGLMGGAMDMMGQQESNCTLKRMQQTGESWDQANYYCTTGGKRTQTDAMGGDANFVEFVNGNLTWYVLMENPLFQSDTEFSEMVMNITGALIMTKQNPSQDDSPVDIREILPAIDNGDKTERFENIYTALLFGSDSVDSMKIYRCQPGAGGGALNSKDGCNNPTSDLQSVTPSWQGLNKRVEDLVVSIQSKIADDQALTPEEVGLVNSTSVPLYRYLSASAAYFKIGTDLGHVKEYSRLIAEDILIKSLKSVVDKVEQQAAVMPGGMSGGERMKEFRERLRGVAVGLAKMREKTNFSIDKYFEMQDRIVKYEQQILARLDSGYIQAAAWGR